jgi:hypothetical protein
MISAYKGFFQGKLANPFMNFLKLQTYTMIMMIYFAAQSSEGCTFLVHGRSREYPENTLSCCML